MTRISKPLRVGAGESSSREVSKAASKPKAKKGFYDPDYHGFFSLNGATVKFSTYSGRRYVQAQDVVDEKFLTTTRSGKAA